MKITGYRSLNTVHDWGRITGDVNGVQPGHATPVPVLIIETDTGVEGVGLGSHADIARVFPAIEGDDPRSVVALYDRMLDWVFKAGHSGSTFGTIGAVDMALWDIKAKAADEPLWRTLGARERFVPGYASGLEYGLTEDELADLYGRFADRGFKAGKLKGGRDLDRDLPRLEIMRDILSRNSRRPALMFDANESWNHAQAARYVAAIEQRMDLTWVEEPLRRWDAAGMAALRGKVRAAIASGENLTGLEQYRPLLDANAVDIVQVGNVWGITHFLRVATLAHAHDLPVSPVAYNANPVAHAAAAVPNHLAFEVQDLLFPVGLDVDQQFDDGGIVLGDRPGIGIMVDESQMSPAGAATPRPAATGPHIRPERAALRLVAEPDVMDDPTHHGGRSS
ncbi:mandelate racemase/muconate lactonizing enzyme family protein [Streptomyces sp. MI02-2A]|jgi:L-alanine-DL-glutamate epimerase-like enolase superfamily enzyme|uniref:mandelate racemase/muconate lactonizing enzyme family protein n=1 Tax=unclassified Streptomyces TaxID=2593676 RepID=UPI0007412B37|nr:MULTISPECIES: mandelate racemase/muconate lactonizing enzyme family protein [unclassified Streptomyces]KUJ35300.1 racemase [Streptomyces sp. NRRL F-5122]MDX3264669.1 mandelate racemase/muconate lactonizing enzyme family protein [Streptomyces sp. MI02-2A]